MAQSSIVEKIIKEIEGHVGAQLSEHVGKVTSVGDGVVAIDGLARAVMSEVVEFEEAKGKYQMYIRLDPSNADAYLNLGRIHQHLSHFETAVEFYKTVLEKDPNRGEAYFQLGLIYKHLERKSDAIEAFENFMRVNPDASNIDQVKKILQELKRF